MTTIGYAALDIIPSLRNVRAEIEKQTAVPMTQAGRAAGDRYGDAAGREAGTAFKGRFSTALRGLAAPLAALGGGAIVGSIFKDAITGASDLAESTSKATIVFGEASSEVLTFGRNASDALGQSEAQALAAAGTFGNLLRSVGLAEGASAEMSTTLVALASDLASFNNTSIDDALTALRSGLVGETEPLKAFGVNLNEATLKAEALRQGLSDGTATLDANAKAQAAFALIMEQTSLAQGDFARTSDGLANQQKILSARWSEMTTNLGKELLPATTAFVGFLADDAIPALGNAGGVAKDLASALDEIPAPVYAAAGAFAALRVASAFGFGDFARTQAANAVSAFTAIRTRAAEAADAYRDLRAASITAEGAGFRFSQGAGRIESSLAAIRTGAAGAGSALRRGFSSAVGLVGGPWGLAFIAGTALLTKFWQESQEAKQHVEEMTAALNDQTGALTKQNKELAFKALQESGAIDLAKDYGIALDTLRRAALGNADAQAEVNAVLNEAGAAFAETAGAQSRASGAAAQYAIDSTRLREAIGVENETLEQSRAAFADQAAFMGKASEATEEIEVRTRDYTAELKSAREAVQGLIEAEEERRLNIIQSKRDEIALIETLKATQKEARKGAETLDLQTAAGRKNFTALLDLADQWNQSTPKVQNARGAYQDLRQSFIEVATQMGKTREEARLLADRLLDVPRNTPIRFQSEGYRERMAEIAALRAAAAGFTSVMDFAPRGFGSTGNTTTTGGGGGGGTATTPKASAPTSGKQVNVNFYGATLNDGGAYEAAAAQKAQQAALGGWG